MRILGLADYIGDSLNILDLFGNICGIIWLTEYKKRCMFEVSNDADQNKCKYISLID